MPSWKKILYTSLAVFIALAAVVLLRREPAPPPVPAEAEETPPVAALLLGGAVWSTRGSVLPLDGRTVTAAELMEKLPHFPALARVSLRSVPLDETEKEALAAAFPQVYFVWETALCGDRVDSGARRLDFSGRRDVDLAELIAAAPRFRDVETIDMTGCGFENAEMLSLMAAYPGADVIWRFSLCGREVCSTDQFVDLSGIEMADASAVEEALPCLPRLKKVVMCGCGLSDEEMDALNKRHPHISFVWTVYFGYYYLRTDATSFIAALWHGGGMGTLTNETAAPLRYCTELVALDLGHMNYTDASFVESMPHLRWLILADGYLADVTPLAGLQELYYLEIFMTPITDISPLLSCKSLRHLDMCYCNGVADLSPLYEMTQLERLWCCGPRMSYDLQQRLAAALPDTELYIDSVGGSTGGTWRYHEAYYSMRDYMGVYYLPAYVPVD